jgi:hypothetical protein
VAAFPHLQRHLPPVVVGSPRLNLSAIEASLRAVQREFDRINRRLSAQRDPLSDDVVANMLAGYALVDALVEARVDIFAMGQLKSVLELNKVVLCGAGDGDESARHLKATENRFYEEREGGIQDIVEWLALHSDESAWKRAAGVYVRMLSKPQLFIEGNHRTGVLVMSYLLLCDAKPPFVLTVDNAEAFFDPSTVIRDIRKKSPASIFRLPGIKKRFAKFLCAQADLRYLRAAAPSPEPRARGARGPASGVA